MKGLGRDRARQTEKTKSVPFQKLFSFADGVDYILMLAGTVGAIGNGICMPLTAVLLGELVDTFGSQTATTQQLVQNVSKVSLKYVYLAVGCGIAAFLRIISEVVCWMVTGERQSARIRCLYLRSILGKEIGYFDKETSSGEIMGRISGDTFLIQDAIGEKVGKFIQLVATFVGGFIIALIKGWLLTLVLLSSIPLLVISAGTMTIIISKLTSRSQDAYTEAAVLVEETIASIRTVASFNGEGRAIEKYDKTLVIAYRSGVQAGLAAGLGSGLFMFVLFCTYAMAVWYGGTLILHRGRGGYTGGDVINVVAAVLAGSYSLGQASPCMSAFASGKVAAFKMLETMSINTNNTDSPHDDMILINPYDKKGKVLLDSDLRGHIQLRDLYFSYPTRSDNRPVLSGLSLSIPSGTTMALVGQSGSGKSTVISLLLRFYDPLSGHILIDGVNLKDFQLQWIRQKMGVVSQEPVLFSTTIKDNIAYGKNDATINEIITATQLANISNFIHKLPQGLETMVGEHGMQLSGGQKQRIAVARAILKDPRILLLDEATSALDAESERVLQQALDRVMVNRTTLVVAHRLTTVKNADMIAVIHQGKIVENGSHAELVQDPNGAYSQLIRLQEKMVSNESEKNVQGIAKEITLNSLSYSNLGGACSRISKHWSSATTTTVEEESPEEEAKNNNNNKNFVVPLCRLVYLNKPELPVLIMGSVAAVLSGLVMPVYGALLSYMIKTFFEPPHELRRESRFWALMFAILSIATLVAMPLRSYLFGLAGCRLIQRVRSMCFKRVVHMEMSWFDQQQHSPGAIGARLSTDAALLRALVGDTLALILQNAATAISGVAIAFQANWLLALIILAMVPLMAANGYLQVKFISGFSADAKKLYEEATQVASDAVANIRTVASFCAEEKVNGMYCKKCEAPIKAGIKQGVICGAGYGFSLFLLFLVYAISFYAGSKLIRSGNISFPEVFRVFFGLSMATIGVSQSLAFSPDTSRAKIAAASVFAILDQKSKIDSSYESSGTTLDEVNGEIELRNVCFRYPTRPDTEVLRDVCLTIQPGKTVALVGESGSGKSTIIHLLQRFYEPNSGKILVDMVDIQQLNLKWLRQQMGLVSQEPLLFNQTIRYNIAYGCSQNAHVSETDVMAAAMLANAHEFISGLEKGYETIVGERGIQLSGGQKQRIAIARAIVKAPKILLLDEATSALDAESERLVQEALDRTMADRTTVVVAHRLSSVKAADLIVVLKDGVIAEKGNHQSLINRNNGLYASLVTILATVNKAATHSIPIPLPGSIDSQPL